MDPFPRRAPEIMLSDPQSWNAYSYARNNPVNFTDPNGEVAMTPDTAVDGTSFLYNTGKWAYNTSKGLVAAVKGDFATANEYFDKATENAVSALTDVAFAAIPGVSATGVKWVDDAAGAMKGKKNAAAEASAKQMEEKGVKIAGEGTKTKFKDAEKWAAQYGGEPSDYVKVSSTSVGEAPNGNKFQTHWVENTKTGEKYGQKTKFQN